MSRKCRRPRISIMTAFGAVAAVVSGCMDAADRGLGPACEAEVRAAERDFDAAKAGNLGGVFDLTKAAALIAAARSQQQFDEYQNCLIKAQNAREILSRRK